MPKLRSHDEGLFFCLVPRSSDENEMRKAFTVSERVAIAEAVAERLAQRHGSNQYAQKGVGNISHSTDEQGRTKDLAAAKAGLGSGKTLEAAM